LSLNSQVFSSGFGGSRDVVISLGIVNNLSFNGDVLNSFVDSLNWFLNHDSLFDLSSDVFNLSLNCIVVSDGSLYGHSFISNNFFVFDDLSLNRDLIDLLNLLVFNVFLLERNVLDSALNWDISGNCFLGNSR